MDLSVEINFLSVSCRYAFLHVLLFYFLILYFKMAVAGQTVETGFRRYMLLYGVVSHRFETKTNLN